MAKRPNNAPAEPVPEKRKPGRPRGSAKGLSQAKAEVTSKPAKAVVTSPARRGRPPGKASKSAPKAGALTRAFSKKAGAPPAAPKLNVAELRARVEKLEATIVTLRQKGRDAGKAAKESTARIEELESHLGKFERKAPAKAMEAAPPKSKPPKAGRGNRKQLSAREPAAHDAEEHTQDEAEAGSSA